MAGLQDSVGHSRLYQSFFNVALAVVLEKLAELGVDDGGEDEVLDFVVEGGFDHVFARRWKLEDS